MKNGEIADINGYSTRLTGTKRIIASFFGVAGGILAGVFGISGTPPVTAGLYSLGLPAILVVGTTVFVLIFNSARRYWRLLLIRQAGRASGNSPWWRSSYRCIYRA